MDNKLWELLKKIYEKAENKQDFVNNCNNYWDGKLSKDIITFKDQDRTAFNVIKPIVETKLKAMLDAEFTLCVVPTVKSFSSLQTIKDQQAIADIYNDELLNILQNNNMDVKKEIVARSGLNCGFGAAQVVWDDNKNEIGEVVITNISSDKLRWDRDASTINDASFIGYSFSMSPAAAKNKYAKNEDGSFDEELCEKIDNIAEGQFNSKESGSAKAVVNYKTANGGGQLYSTGDKSDGICAGKTVNLVCLFLVDDSMFAPNKDDNEDEEDFKEEQIAKYPNGRMIIFSLNEKEKLILKDEALPKSFNSLGNIAVFNPTKWGGIAGKGEVEDLRITQDRINGLYNKYRKSLEDDFTAIAIEKNEDTSESDIIKLPVWYMKPDSMTPAVISNGGMEKATQALSMIEQLENHAAKMARVNETMIYGYRQSGTTSGEQVQMLQESPLADIRAMQRNFKDFYIDIGNKCLDLIKNNYTVDRMIKLSTGMNKADFAKLKLNSVSGEPEVELINEAGQAIKTIKMNPDWEFCVEVSAGTSVPRTRREQAVLMDTLIDRGLLPISDINVKEQYFKVQDIPNYRILIKLLRDKEAQDMQAAQDPASRDWKEMMKNPEIAKVFADTFSKIAGYSLAQQQMLQEVGLVPNPGKLDNTPVTELTSQSDVAQVATMANIVSENPNVAMAGRNAAIAEQLTDINQ